MRRLNWWWGDLCWLKQAPVYDSLLLSLALCAHLPHFQCAKAKVRGKFKRTLSFFFWKQKSCCSARATVSVLFYCFSFFCYYFYYYYWFFMWMIKLIYLKSWFFCLFTQWEGGVNTKCKGVDILLPTSVITKIIHFSFYSDSFVDICF